jgi:hypothetical protein
LREIFFPPRPSGPVPLLRVLTSISLDDDLCPLGLDRRESMAVFAFFFGGVLSVFDVFPMMV